MKAAVEIDPDFADAHTALADAWAVRGYYGGVPTWEAWSRARAAVDEAERIAPDSAGVALSRGILEHYYGWNVARLEHFCRLAIERNPKSADPWTWLAIGYAASGRRDDAVEAGARGIALEPHHRERAHVAGVGAISSPATTKPPPAFSKKRSRSVRTPATRTGATASRSATAAA